jgi:uncharacterized HAD superfamily protein
MTQPSTHRTVVPSSLEPDTDPDADARAVEPRRPGEVARWRILYDAMFKLKPGDLITYADMGDMLGLDIDVTAHKAMLHGALRKAVDELLARHRMVFHLVRGRGYQVARPGQVIEVARQHQARAFVEIESGHTKIEAIDTTQVDNTTARLIEATAIGFARQAVIMRQLDVRQNRLETAMAALAVTANTAVSRADETATRVDATEAELTELRKRIAELEAQQRSGG